MFQTNPAFHRFSRRLIFFSLLSFFICSYSFAQNKRIDKKTEKANELFQQSQILADSAKYNDAISLLKEAKLIYEKKKNYEKVILCENEIVKQSRNIKFNDELLSKAKINSRLACELLGSNHYLTGESISLIGHIFADINKPDSALRYFYQSIEIWKFDSIKNEELIADGYGNIGKMYTEKGEYETAAKYIYKNLWLKTKVLGSEHCQIPDIYNALGILYYYKGSVDSCVYYFKKALDLCKRCFDNEHPRLAKAYNNAGISYELRGDLDTTLLFYQKSHEIKLKRGILNTSIAAGYNNIGLVYSKQGKNELANEYFFKGAAICLKLKGERDGQLVLANCYKNLGDSYKDIGEVGNVLVYTKKAFDIIMDLYGPQNSNSAKFYHKMGMAHIYGDGDLDKALSYFKKGLELTKKRDPKSSLLSAINNNIGIIYRKKGENELALSYYKSALEVFTSQKIEKHKGVAIACNNIGALYVHLEDYEQAMQYLNRSIRIKTELFGKDYVEIADSYDNLGSIYGAKGNYKKAEEFFRKSLDILIKNFGAESVVCTRVYNYLAENAKNENNLNIAIDYLKHSVKILKRVYANDHPDLGNTFAKLANTYLKFQYFDSAEHYLKLSLDANYIGELPINVDYNLILDEIQYLKALFELADLYYNRYAKENRIRLLEHSVGYFQKGSEMVNYLVSGYHIEASKLGLLEEASNYYAMGLVAAEAFYKNRKSEKEFLQMLAFSEQTKSTVLYQSIVRSKLKRDDNVEDALWLKYQNLSGRISFLKNKILSGHENKIDSARLHAFDVELTKKIIDFQNLNQEIEKWKVKKQYAYFSNRQLIRLIQENLKQNEVMLEYSLTDSLLFCFVIGNDFYELAKTKVDSSFENELLNYVSIIKKHRFQQFQESSHYLYSKLLKPIEQFFDNKTKLIIIPDGQLLSLPFGSLISRKQNFNNVIKFSNLDYLIKDFEIVYQYSANLWLESINCQKNREFGDGFLGLAPFVSNDICEKLDSTNLSFMDKDLPETILRNVTNKSNEFRILPFSGKEINEIANLFTKNGFRTKKFLGKDASEEKLKNSARDFKYLHIATHGIINNIHPELSGLAFLRNKEPNEKENLKDWRLEQNTDGILYTNEIYDLDLNADLMVLSACETGIGEFSRGEGVLSVTRGFLYNQVPNIVFSLWKINDKSTCDLMIDFYKNILQNRTYSNALRQAKLKVINDKNTAYPSNWAAFSLIGR